MWARIPGCPAQHAAGLGRGDELVLVEYLCEGFQTGGANFYLATETSGTGGGSSHVEAQRLLLVSQAENLLIQRLGVCHQAQAGIGQVLYVYPRPAPRRVAGVHHPAGFALLKPAVDVASAAGLVIYEARPHHHGAHVIKLHRFLFHFHAEMQDAGRVAGYRFAHQLLERKRRFKELSRDIGISPNILAKELQELELNNLVTRTVCDTRSVTVEYAITEHSRTLVNVVEALTEWGFRHHKAVVGKKRFVDPAATGSISRLINS